MKHYPITQGCKVGQNKAGKDRQDRQDRQDKWKHINADNANIMRMEGEREMENNLYHRELFTVGNSSFSL